MNAIRRFGEAAGASSARAVRRAASGMSHLALIQGVELAAVGVVQYFLATRGIFGRTAGEALLNTSYRPRKRQEADAIASQL